MSPLLSILTTFKTLISFSTEKMTLYCPILSLYTFLYPCIATISKDETLKLEFLESSVKALKNFKPIFLFFL